MFTQYTDCVCNSTTIGGYGNCQKRSWRIGGYFWCFVNENTNCSDKKVSHKYDTSFEHNYYVSRQACKHVNIGKPLKSFIVVAYCHL